jgi:hypothetical protein
MMVEVRAAFDDSSNTPSNLATGVSINGQTSSPGKMNVNEVGVQIANSGGTADGELGLKICQSGLCREGSRDLGGSVDNDYIWIRLTQSLPITISDGEIRYEITRKSGVKGMFVWMYPSYSTKTYAEISGVKSQITPNIVFRQY